MNVLIVHRIPCLYFCVQHNDTRMNVLIALTSCQSGAAAANYVGVTQILHSPSGAAAGENAIISMSFAPI